LKKLKRFSRSFSLIEAVIACGILMMASAATAAVAVVSIHGSVVNKHKAQATMLAQDAISQLIMQREKNYQTSDNWDFGFVNKQNSINNICIGYKFTNSSYGAGFCGTLASDYLEFKRIVTLTKMSFDCSPPNPACPCDSSFSDPFACVGNTALTPDFSDKTYKVTIEVKWSDYGQEQSVKIITLLTDYKPKY